MQTNAVIIGSGQSHPCRWSPWSLFSVFCVISVHFPERTGLLARWWGPKSRLPPSMDALMLCPILAQASLIPFHPTSSNDCSKNKDPLPSECWLLFYVRLLLLLAKVLLQDLQINCWLCGLRIISRARGNFRAWKWLLLQRWAHFIRRDHEVTRQALHHGSLVESSLTPPVLLFEAVTVRLRVTCSLAMKKCLWHIQTSRAKAKPAQAIVGCSHSPV